MHRNQKFHRIHAKLWAKKSPTPRGILNSTLSGDNMSSIKKVRKQRIHENESNQTLYITAIH